MATNASTILADEGPTTSTIFQPSSPSPDRVDNSIELPLRSVPVPTPRPLMRRRMYDVAALIGGPAESLPVGRQQDATRALHLPMASLIVMGTACSRPLLQEEAARVSEVTNRAVVIARLEYDPAIPEGLTFDYLARPGADWIERALMWQDTTCHGVWLVPAEGEGQSVRLSAFSREVISRSPFYSIDERNAGLFRAANSLRSLKGGR